MAAKAALSLIICTLVPQYEAREASAAVRASVSSAYAQQVQNKILTAWDKTRPSMNPAIIIGFQVDPDGVISDVRIKCSNAGERSKQLALDIVKSASPIEAATFLRSRETLSMEVSLGFPPGFDAEMKKAAATSDRLWREGKRSEAERAKLATIEKSKKALGKDFPQTAELYLELANFYECNEQHRQAEDALKQAVLIYEKCFAQSPRDYCVWLSAVCTKLANLLVQEGSYGDAEGYYKRAIEVDKSLPSKSWSGFFEDPLRMADYYLKRKRDNDAEKTLLYAVSLVDQSGSKNDPASLEGYATIGKLANFYADHKKYDAAQKYFEQLLNIYSHLPRPVSGADDFDWFDGYKKMLAAQNRAEDLDKLNKRLEPILISGNRKVDPARAFGYLNNKGEFAIQPKYWNASDFSDGYAAVCLQPATKTNSEQKYAFIDRNGKIAFNKTFYFAQQFRDGYSQVTLTKTSLPRVIDTKGDLLPDKFRKIYKFSDGLAAAEIIDATSRSGRGYQLGYVNEKMELVIPAKFDIAEDFSHDRAIAGITGTKIERMETRRGVIDKSGAWLIQPKYSELKEISPDKYSFRDNREYGIVDTTGEELTRQRLTEMGTFHEGMARISMPRDPQDRHSKWVKGFMDDSGHIIIKPVYDEVSDFQEGLAAVKKGEEWGYVDRTGGLVIDRQFTAAYPFNEGLAAVNTSSTKNPMYEGTFGFIDKTGKMIIPAIIYGAQKFHEGVAAVRFRVTPNTYGYIDKTGQVLVGPTLAYAEEMRDGVARVTVGGGFNRKFGYVDASGKFIVKPEYSVVGNFHDGLCFASRGTDSTTKRQAR